MERWVRLCAAGEVPAIGQVTEVDIDGRALCLANIDGEIHALDNVCPHRGGPLGQGWLEGRAVLCPWHAWAFNVDTGIADEPEQAKVQVFPVRPEGDDLFVNLD